jgi:hypothetical protein
MRGSRRVSAPVVGTLALLNKAVNQVSRLASDYAPELAGPVIAYGAKRMLEGGKKPPNKKRKYKKGKAVGKMTLDRSGKVKKVRTKRTKKKRKTKSLKKRVAALERGQPISTKKESTYSEFYILDTAFSLNVGATYTDALSAIDVGQESGVLGWIPYHYQESNFQNEINNIEFAGGATNFVTLGNDAKLKFKTFAKILLKNRYATRTKVKLQLLKLKSGTAERPLTQMKEAMENKGYTVSTVHVAKPQITGTNLYAEKFPEFVDVPRRYDRNPYFTYLGRAGSDNDWEKVGKMVTLDMSAGDEATFSYSTKGVYSNDDKNDSQTYGIKGLNYGWAIYVEGEIGHGDLQKSSAPSYWGLMGKTAGGLDIRLDNRLDLEVDNGIGARTVNQAQEGAIAIAANAVYEVAGATVAQEKPNE